MSSLRTTARRGGATSAGLFERLARARQRFGPLAMVALPVVGFIAISVWWVHTDFLLPSGDNGKHLAIAFGLYDDFRNGFFGVPFKAYYAYPPGVHLVGAVGSLIFGPSRSTAVITENAVFVPMLAAGCYGVARRAFNRFAGVLAVLFALASPMVISLSHVFMLDLPTAAVVSVTVWALVESDRFANVSVSALAGLGAAFGLYCKSTFPIFIAGVVLVMLLRGGWRNWRGLVAFVAVPAVIAGPWYVYHFNDLTGQTKGAVNPQALNWYGNVPYPSQWSVSNFTWYWWNLINNQVYVPLAALFVVGFVSGLVRMARRRLDRRSVIPELMAGAVVSYIGISLITLDDPRYTIPGLVYLAVLATGWIARLRRSLAWGLAAATAVILVLNTLNLNWDWPGWYSVLHLPSGHIDNPIGEGNLTLVSPHGYIESEPNPHAAEPVLRLLERARADGAHGVVFESDSMNNGGYNLNGLVVFARAAGLGVLGFDRKQAHKHSDITIFRRLATQRGLKGAKPCLMSTQIADGTALFVQWGPERPNTDFHCPR